MKNLCARLRTTHPRHRHFGVWLALCVLTVFSLSWKTSRADEPSRFELSGFGTLGASYSNNTKADYLRDLTQTVGVGHSRKLDFGLDSNLGLQIDWHSPAPAISAAAQTVIKRDHAGMTPDLTLAFARYSDDQWNIRTGRIGFDVYPNADSRLIGYSYVWQRPPVEFFGPLIFSHLDGADAQLRIRDNDREWRLKVYSGVTNEKIEITKDYPFFVLNHSRLHGGHIEYKSDPWSIRLSTAYLHIANENPALQDTLKFLRTPSTAYVVPNAANIAQRLQMQDKQFRFTALSFTYDKTPWLAELMIGKTLTGCTFIPDYKSGFFSLSWRKASWTYFGVLSAIRPLGETEEAVVVPGAPSEIIAFTETLNQQMRQQAGWQTSLTLGVRYDLSAQSNLKVQFDHVHSRENLLIRKVQPDWNRKANIISLSYNFIF